MNENIDNYNKKNKIELFEIVTIILTNKIKILISSLVIFAIAVFLHQFFLKNNYDANLNKTKSLFNFTIEINKNELNQIIDYLNSFFVVRQVVFNDINSIKKFETTTTNLIPQTDQNNTPLIKYHQEMLLESLRFFFNNIDVQFEIIKNQLQKDEKFDFENIAEVIKIYDTKLHENLLILKVESLIGDNFLFIGDYIKTFSKNVILEYYHNLLYKAQNTIVTLIDSHENDLFLYKQYYKDQGNVGRDIIFDILETNLNILQNHKTKMENQVLSKINSEIYSNIVNIYLGDNYDFETNITKRGNLKIINIFVLYSIFGFFSLSISTFIIVLNRKYNEYSKT